MKTTRSYCKYGTTPLRILKVHTYIQDRNEENEADNQSEEGNHSTVSYDIPAIIAAQIVIFIFSYVYTATFRFIHNKDKKGFRFVPGRFIVSRITGRLGWTFDMSRFLVCARFSVRLLHRWTRRMVDWTWRSRIMWAKWQSIENWLEIGEGCSRSNRWCD